MTFFKGFKKSPTYEAELERLVTERGPPRLAIAIDFRPHITVACAVDSLSMFDARIAVAPAVDHCLSSCIVCPFVH